MRQITDPEKKKQMEGHRERLRRRFQDEGIDSFREDYEVLELLLQYALPRRDTKALAKKLIEHFGSLHEVLDASQKELVDAGVTENTAVLITLIPAVEKRYHMSRAKGLTHVRSTADAGQICTAMFRNQRDESVRVLCLNAGGKIVKRAELVKGDVNAVHFPVRKIVETAVGCKAVSVILTHNHPGGTLAPSREDLDATQAAKAALETVGVRLVDHLIVAEGDYCSLRENGFL
ncbi:MAG: DNA repair protein RadC [Oscillospiraceae bacterium]|nr:DNA repair protein RadC [Oscillospiraceae bacterium]